MLLQEPGQLEATAIFNATAMHEDAVTQQLRLRKWIDEVPHIPSAALPAALNDAAWNDQGSSRHGLVMATSGVRKHVESRTATELLCHFLGIPLNSLPTIGRDTQSSRHSYCHGVLWLYMQEINLLLTSFCSDGWTVSSKSTGGT